MDTQHSDSTHDGEACHGPGYASPLEAMKAEREKVLYTVALHDGTGVELPGYLATIDVDPARSALPSQPGQHTRLRRRGTQQHTLALG